MKYTELFILFYFLLSSSPWSLLLSIHNPNSAQKGFWLKTWETFLLSFLANQLLLSWKDFIMKRFMNDTTWFIWPFTNSFYILMVAAHLQLDCRRRWFILRYLYIHLSRVWCILQSLPLLTLQRHLGETWMLNYQQPVFIKSLLCR